MAQFSLSLTNGRGTTVLTQYDSVAGQTAGLTFDEHLNLSTDGSTLTFSMLKYLYEASQKVVNTAALSIVYGSVIRCDHNGYRDDFAVTEINYNFLSENLQLSFTAQDYFQFEVSKLGIGYTITTDTTDPEYLGAQPIDEWAYKIIQDNNIRWTYTPINTANSEIINILNNGHEKELLFDTESTETGYWDQVEASKTLNQWVSFECSNSNAFAALKQLASDNELIIVVDYSNHSFCFKPQKSFIFNGYYFNPSNNLQAFSLRGNADNLITVLNITGGKDLNDQEITLVPNMPGPVKNWVQGSDWLNTKYYPELYDQFATDFPQFVREIAYTPWFENKLIDISYYQNNNLLIPIEVSEIQDILYNQLRIVNARMIAARSTYLTKYEEDYMAINQRRIEVETLSAGLAADVESLRQSDLTKPPIFITQGSDGTDVRNWVYIAPGTNLYASIDDGLGEELVTYKSLNNYNGRFKDYLGPTRNSIDLNYPGTNLSLSTSIIVTPKFGSPIRRSGSFISYNSNSLQYSIMSDSSVAWSQEFNDLDISGETDVAITLPPLLTNYSYNIIVYSNVSYSCRVNNGRLEVLSGGPTPTLTGNTVKYASLSGVFRVIITIANIPSAGIELYSYTDTTYYTLLLKRYGLDLTLTLTCYSAHADDYIVYDNTATLISGNINADILNKLNNTIYIYNKQTAEGATRLPSYIYINSSLPDAIRLRTSDGSNSSATLTVTADNLNNQSLTSLLEAQMMSIATPDKEIAGLVDHLNTYSATRETMLQHLADNWGALLKEWYRPIYWTYNATSYTYYINNIYASYRKINMPASGDSIIEVGDPWNTGDAIINLFEIELLKQICGTNELKYSTIVTTMQSIHTKITEYWTQCYNAAMSLGIYWPQDWDCLDILEKNYNNHNTIFAFNTRLLGLLTGRGMSDAYRWEVGYPLLNLYYAPSSSSSLFPTLIPSITWSGTSALGYDLYSNTATDAKCIQIDGNFIATYNNSSNVLVQQNYDFSIGVAHDQVFSSTTYTLMSFPITLPDNTSWTISLRARYGNIRLFASGPSSPITNTITLTGSTNLYRYLGTEQATHTYAHSYKFMDDNDSWRIIRSRSDQTQFDYQRLDSTTDQPYDNILENHSSINDNLNLYKADLRYKSEHYTFNYSACKLPSQWLAAAVDFGDNADRIQPTGEGNPAANPNLALISYLAKARQYDNSTYYNTLYEHNQLWQKLLQRYPGVFRESVYQNTNAINSQELYESAKRELTKLSQPEYSYTLTGMDIYMYDSDYIPTRIKLGEQIRIDYQELGELNDSLNAALREPLYVTGINHTLRNDGDYQFTVITRTATDTMMQRFAKLLTLNR